MLTAEDIKMYGTSDLRFIEGQDELFSGTFDETDIGQRLEAEDLNTVENFNKILKDADTSDAAVQFDDFVRVARRLYLIGALKPKTVVAAVEPEVERDKLGRPLSPKAKQWRQWETWCNDRTTKMSDIDSLRRTNTDFAEFYAYQTNLRMREESIGDAAEAVGTAAVRQDKTRATDELKTFAFTYLRTSADDVRKFTSPAMNPLGHKQYADSLNRCIAAGLL